MVKHTLQDKTVTIQTVKAAKKSKTQEMEGDDPIFFYGLQSL